MTTLLPSTPARRLRDERLQCQKGTDEINHGGTKFIVNNYTWQVDVDDEVADFMIKDGRAGVCLVEERKDGDSSVRIADLFRVKEKD